MRAELDAIGRAEVSRIKAFLTRTTDRFRPPYGRYTVEVPRQCCPSSNDLRRFGVWKIGVSVSAFGLF